MTLLALPCPVWPGLAWPGLTMSMDGVYFSRIGIVGPPPAVAYAGGERGIRTGGSEGNGMGFARACRAAFRRPHEIQIVVQWHPLRSLRVADVSPGRSPRPGSCWFSRVSSGAPASFPSPVTLVLVASQTVQGHHSAERCRARATRRFRRPSGMPRRHPVHGHAPRSDPSRTVSNSMLLSGRPCTGNIVDRCAEQGDQLAIPRFGMFHAPMRAALARLLNVSPHIRHERTIRGG